MSGRSADFSFTAYSVHRCQQLNFFICFGQADTNPMRKRGKSCCCSSLALRVDVEWYTTGPGQPNREDLHTMSINRIGSLLLFRGINERLFATRTEDLCLAPRHLPLGSRVRIKRGVFEGVEGRINSFLPTSRIAIAVDNCRGASIEIDERMVEVVDG
jgi:hypothetical protein